MTMLLCRVFRANSITGGLVKGALSVAASAYKALFTGQSGPEQVSVFNSNALTEVQTRLHVSDIAHFVHSFPKKRPLRMP